MTHSLRTLVACTVAGVLAIALAACERPAPVTDEATDTTTETEDAADAPDRFATVDEVLEAYPDADAAVRIEPVGDGAVHGYLTFEDTGEGTRVRVNLTGLEPGERAFHVHEHGSCDAGEDGAPAGAAGGHFNPMGHPHGAPDDPPDERHVGDLGNLDVADDGTARTTFEDPVARLQGEANIIGRALIVHERRDDLETQPTGDAGGRIGCGIITARDA